MHKEIGGMTPRLRNIVGIFGFLATWQLLASLGVINALLLPSPLRVIEATLELLADGSLLRHVLASLDRVLIGFLVAAASGILIGLVTGWDMQNNWPRGYCEADEAERPLSDFRTEEDEAADWFEAVARGESSSEI